MNKIQETSEYGEISLIKGNRPIIEKQVQRIAASMTAIGWMVTSLVLMVVMAGKKYVLCGQHRVKAAQRAKVPVRYAIVGTYPKNDEATRNIILRMIQKDSADTVQWSTAAFLHSFIVKGAEEYIALNEWMEDNTVEQIETALILLGKDNSSRALREFKDGEFTMGDAPRAERRLAQIREIASMGKFSFVFNRNFVRAFCKVSELEEYDHKEFLRVLGLPKQNAMFVKQVDVPSYQKLMQESYNYGKHRANKVFFV